MAKRKHYSPEFKAKVVLDLVNGDDPLSVVASRHDLNPTMLSGWRKQFLNSALLAFSTEKEQVVRREAAEKHEQEVDNLNRIIGQLTVERDYLQRSFKDESRGNVW